MDCPVCGSERTERSAGGNLTVIECPSCQRLSLWRVGLFALAGLPRECVTRARPLVHGATKGLKRVAAKTVAAISRRPTS